MSSNLAYEILTITASLNPLLIDIIKIATFISDGLLLKLNKII